MSVLKHLAAGAAGALEGGTVLAKGEQEKRKVQLWDYTTEVTRKNNMDTLSAKQKHAVAMQRDAQAFTRSREEVAWTNKEGTTIRRAEQDAARAEAKRRKIPFEEVAAEKGWLGTADQSIRIVEQTAVGKAQEELDARKSDLRKTLSEKEFGEFSKSFIDFSKLSAFGRKGSLLSVKDYMTFVKDESEAIRKQYEEDPERLKALATEAGQTPEQYINAQAEQNILSRETSRQPKDPVTSAKKEKKIELRKDEVKQSIDKAKTPEEARAKAQKILRDNPGSEVFNEIVNTTLNDYLARVEKLKASELGAGALQPVDPRAKVKRVEALERERGLLY